MALTMAMMMLMLKLMPKMKRMKADDDDDVDANVDAKAHCWYIFVVLLSVHSIYRPESTTSIACKFRRLPNGKQRIEIDMFHVGISTENLRAH